VQAYSSAFSSHCALSAIAISAQPALCTTSERTPALCETHPALPCDLLHTERSPLSVPVLMSYSTQSAIELLSTLQHSSRSVILLISCRSHLLLNFLLPAGTWLLDLAARDRYLKLHPVTFFVETAAWCWPC
jgi:hypothetical protein